MGSPEAGYSTYREPEVSSAEGIPPDDRLVPVRPHGDEGNLDGGDLLDHLDVLPGGFRQVAELPGRGDVFLPALHLLVDRPGRLEFDQRQWDLLPAAAVDIVRDAHFNARQGRAGVPP